MLRAKLITEFIGTFFLFALIGLTQDPIAIGLGLAALVYAGGAISGAHFNPAVTIGSLVRRKIPVQEVGPYILAQGAGGLAAALLVSSLRKGDPVTLNPEFLPAFAAEFLFTFLLVWVILLVATNPKTEGNSFFGAAIGATVLAGAYAVGPISGGAFNPAVGAAAIAAGMLSWKAAWYYLVAQVLAGIIAAWVANATIPSSEPAQADSES